MSFVEVIPLVQHTPLIHFQWEQIGASLRASEVKSAILRYLAKEDGINYYDPKERKKLTDKYKFQIFISSKIVNIKTTTKSEPYWGDFRKINYSEVKIKVQMQFGSENKNEVIDNLPRILAIENFGSSSNKGYGGFAKEGQDRTVFEPYLKSYYKNIFYWETDQNNDEEIFFQIKYFYALFKSGINLKKDNFDPAKNTYYKSLLMKYFLPDIRWEKRGIKKKFIPIKSRNASFLDDGVDHIPANENYKAIKPLFGYSKSQKWQSYSKEIKIEFPDKKNIERIISPIFFKVFKGKNNDQKTRIYFMLKDEDKFTNVIYPDKSFSYTINNKTEPFNTPEKFDYANFITYSVNEINTNLISNNSATSYPAKKIDDFIRELTKNKIKLL